MSHGNQRQRHGVKKNLAEGIGGLVVGAALVVLIGQLRRRRAKTPPTRPDATASNESPTMEPTP